MTTSSPNSDRTLRVGSYIDVELKKSPRRNETESQILCQGNEGSPTDIESATDNGMTASPPNSEDTFHMACHIGKELAKSSGSSGLESQILPEGEESNSAREEIVVDPMQTISATHEAANTARKAALSCEKTMGMSASLLKLVGKRMAKAANIVETEKIGGRKILLIELCKFRSLTEDCRKALNAVLRRTNRAEIAVKEAYAAASDADHRATELAEVIDTQLEAIPDRQQSAFAAAEAAKVKEQTAYVTKYLLLSAMHNAMLKANYRTNPCCVNTRSPGNKLAKRTVNFLIAALFGGGCFLLIFHKNFKGKDTYGSYLFAAIFIFVLGSVALLLKLLRHVYSWRKSVEREAREKTSDKFWKEMCDLRRYLEINAIPQGFDWRKDVPRQLLNLELERSLGF